jgi:hypothetical protein
MPSAVSLGVVGTVGAIGAIGAIGAGIGSIGIGLSLGVGVGLASIVGLKVLTNSQSLESAKCGFWQLEHLGVKCSQGVLEPQVLHLWLVV